MTIPSILASTVRMIEKAFPQIAYSYPRTYVVHAVNADKTIDLKPTLENRHLRDLPAVEQWGLGKTTPPVGAAVLVLFRDGQPDSPIVLPWDFADTPVRVEIDASSEIDLGTAPTRGAARMDDTIEAGSWSFTFAAGTLTVAYTPSTGTPKAFTLAVVAGVLVFTPIAPYAGGAIATTGKITSSSNKVKVE